MTPVHRIHHSAGWQELVLVDCPSVVNAIGGGFAEIVSAGPMPQVIGFRWPYPMLALTPLPLVSAARALLDAITFDDSGQGGRGGNGGLISHETIRKGDALRLLLDEAERL
jgi:hypothetical protein